MEIARKKKIDFASMKARLCEVPQMNFIHAKHYHGRRDVILHTNYFLSRMVPVRYDMGFIPRYPCRTERVVYLFDNMYFLYTVAQTRF